VIDAVKALPRVTAVTVAQGVPMKPGTFWGNFEVEGQPSRRDEKPEARIRVVNPGYFHVMQIPLVSGREFELRDEVGNVGDLPYVIINHTLASRYWPGEDAVGKRLLFMSGPATIIGVARDVKYMGLDSKPDPELYYPLGLYPQPHITLLVRTSSNPFAIISDVRKRIAGVDKDAFTDVKTMDQLIDETLAPRRFATTLLSTFGAVALLLSLTGIYGVISHMVTQRTREIGIRVALGAPAGKIITLMLQCGFLPASAGVAIGCLAAFSTTNLLSAMLFEVGALDPSVWLIVSTGMLAVACLASYLPARRACTIDPCISIKAE